MNATETPGTSASASAIAPPTHALLMTIDRRSAYRGWDGSARKRRDVPTRSSERIPSATRLSASCCTELGLTPIMRAASRSPTVRSGSARSRASSLARVRDPKSRSSAMHGAYNGVGRMSKRTRQACCHRGRPARLAPTVPHRPCPIPNASLALDWDPARSTEAQDLGEEGRMQQQGGLTDSDHDRPERPVFPSLGVPASFAVSAVFLLVVIILVASKLA